MKFALLCVVMLWSAGCDVQRGRFVATGVTSYPLQSPVGSIDIVDGHERKADLISDEHLLYILIITPAAQEQGAGGSNTYGKYVTTLNHSWRTEKSTFSASISWDRQADIVTIGKQQFNRSNGNVFVAHLDADGEISGQQLASIESHSNCQKVLQYIQQQQPNDKVISSIQLYK
jgi:hypothetical protein